jgi:two-component system cell cycle sensor histidine kinase/response regulator CckA
LFALLIWCTQGRISKIKECLVAEQQHNKDSLHLREQLEQTVAHSERVESLGVLAGGIAHDFNNLLMGVIANAETMQSLPKDSEQHGQCLNGVLQSAELAAELSQKLLTYVGKQITQPVATDLNALVAGLVPLVKTTFRFKHEVSFESRTENAFAEIDVAQIEQVLLNLMVNAVNAINLADRNGDGVISISVGQESIDNPECAQDVFGTRTAEGDFVYFEVADTGVGIPDADISRVFEPFFTGHEAGRGLGLAVVLGNVKRHGGFIRCQSTVGKGTSFRILLPRSTQAPTNHPSNGSTGINRLSKQLLLVAIDDQPLVLDSIDCMLSDTQWKRELFDSADDALQYIESNTDAVDIVLVDGVMPGMDGGEFLAKLASSDVHLPVIMMSGYGRGQFEELQQQYVDCKAFLGKPFSRQDLYCAIVTCIGDETESKTVT